MHVDNDKVVFVDDKGNRTELKIYFTWKSNTRDKEYVFFYDEMMPEELIAGIIEKDGTISDVEDDDEYDELEEVIKAYEEEHFKKNS